MCREVPHCELKLHVSDRRHNPYQQHLHNCAETLHLSAGGRWPTNHYSGLKCAVEISAKMGVNSAHSSRNDTTLTPLGRLYSGRWVSCPIPKWARFCSRCNIDLLPIKPTKATHGQVKLIGKVGIQTEMWPEYCIRIYIAILTSLRRLYPAKSTHTDMWI